MLLTPAQQQAWSSATHCYISVRSEKHKMEAVVNKICPDFPRCLILASSHEKAAELFIATNSSSNIPTALGVEKVVPTTKLIFLGADTRPPLRAVPGCSTLVLYDLPHAATLYKRWCATAMASTAICFMVGSPASQKQAQQAILTDIQDLYGFEFQPLRFGPPPAIEGWRPPQHDAAQEDTIPVNGGKRARSARSRNQRRRTNERAPTPSRAQQQPPHRASTPQPRNTRFNQQTQQQHAPTQHVQRAQHAQHAQHVQPAHGQQRQPKERTQPPRIPMVPRPKRSSTPRSGRNNQHPIPIAASAPLVVTHHPNNPKMRQQPLRAMADARQVMAFADKTGDDNGGVRLEITIPKLALSQLPVSNNVSASPQALPVQRNRGRNSPRVDNAALTNGPDLVEAPSSSGNGGKRTPRGTSGRRRSTPRSPRSPRTPRGGTPRKAWQPKKDPAPIFEDADRLDQYIDSIANLPEEDIWPAQPHPPQKTLSIDDEERAPSLIITEGPETQWRSALQVDMETDDAVSASDALPEQECAHTTDEP
eukprot:TRINITY_DN93484_c0_g1_i1.p1 TRINITY_DN93484_c0_g1~~TRINITY_DN93484_c0_g1_i1.p1  ORF type:complete len:535 (+),score=48.35 TRINITY_DN93484_c0_g1_i1:25-1629(+)